jgi:recombination protein RecA
MSNKYLAENDDPKKLKFVSTGCALFNCVLGGGWPLGRVSNICGKRSSGKTLVAIEACANFARLYPDEKKHLIRYRETEEAFDPDYAKTVGFPEDRAELPDNELETVEAFYTDLKDFIAKVPKNGCGFYVLDSLDAIGDKGELEREFGEKSYGTQKAKEMKKTFRLLKRPLREKNIHLMVISHLYANIGVMLGDKHKRSGGDALDYFATHIVWLTQIGKIKQKVDGIDMDIAIQMRAACKKNKVSAPFRQCDMPIRFGYGIDDFAAGLGFLETTSTLERLSFPVKNVTSFIKKSEGFPPEKFKAARLEINKLVKTVWAEREAKIAPTRSKYG